MGPRSPCRGAFAQEVAVPEARSSRLHGPGDRSRAVGAGYGTYHPPRHPRWSCAETGEAGRGAWEATEVAGLPETRNSVEFTGRVHSGLSAIRIATPARRLYARKRDTGLQRSELGARYGTYHPPRHPRWSTPEPNLR